MYSSLLVWLLIAVSCLTKALPQQASSLDDGSDLPTQPLESNKSTSAFAGPRPHYCFKPTDPHVYPLVPEYCPRVLDFVFLRDGNDEFYKKQIFSNGKHVPPGTHHTPDRWIIQDDKGGYCQLAVSADPQSLSIDTFTLKDVAVKGQIIFKNCVEGQKDNLGGSIRIGNNEGFFVVLTGQSWRDGEMPPNASFITIKSDSQAVQPILIS